MLNELTLADIIRDIRKKIVAVRSLLDVTKIQNCCNTNLKRGRKRQIKNKESCHNLYTFKTIL